MRKMLFRPEGGDTGSTTTTTTTDEGTSGGEGEKKTDTTTTTTEEWKAPENKEALDKLIGDAVEAAKPKAPEKYDLKLPEKAKVDAALSERTAATARTLGLSNEAAQKTLDFIAQEVASQSERAVATAAADWSAPTKENPDGGTRWREQEEAWRAASLADKDLGNGNPQQLATTAGLVKRVLATYFDKDSIEFFEKSGLGSHPALLKGFAKIAKAAGESTLVRPEGEKLNEGKRPADVMYDGNAAKKEVATAA